MINCSSSACKQVVHPDMWTGISVTALCAINSPSNGAVPPDTWTRNYKEPENKNNNKRLQKTKISFTSPQTTAKNDNNTVPALPPLLHSSEMTQIYCMDPGLYLIFSCVDERCFSSFGWNVAHVIHTGTGCWLAHASHLCWADTWPALTTIMEWSLVIDFCIILFCFYFFSQGNIFSFLDNFQCTFFLNTRFLFDFFHPAVSCILFSFLFFLEWTFFLMFFTMPLHPQ